MSTMGDHTKLHSEEVDPLDILEAKTRAIELKLFGTNKRPDTFESTSSPNMVDALLKSQAIMSTAISSQEKISKMVKRMEELDMVLDPSFESATLSNTTKTEMVLLMYEELHNISGQLKLLKESDDVLNSEQIRGTLKVEDRLNSLNKVMHSNKTRVEVSNREVHDMFTRYNILINSFTKMFAQLSEVVTALEIASEPNTVID